MTTEDRAEIAGQFLAELIRGAENGEEIGVQVRGNDVEILVIGPPDGEPGQPAWKATTTIAKLKEGDLLSAARLALTFAREAE